MTSATPSSPAPPVAVPDMIAVTLALADIVERETATLRSNRPGDIASIQSRKEQMSTAYMARCSALRELPDTFAAARPEQRRELRAAALRLAAALDANGRQLRAATVAADRVVGAIVRAVREQRSIGVGYTAGRTLPRRVPAAAGVTLDRRF